MDSENWLNFLDPFKTPNFASPVSNLTFGLLLVAFRSVEWICDFQVREFWTQEILDYAGDIKKSQTASHRRKELKICSLS